MLLLTKNTLVSGGNKAFVTHLSDITQNSVFPLCCFIRQWFSPHISLGVEGFSGSTTPKVEKTLSRWFTFFYFKLELSGNYVVILI